MAQWEKLRQLDNLYLKQVDELYDKDAFPMDVRHYLASWIEGQDWERAGREHDFAMVLFQSLLENLDIQHSRFVQEGESFLLQHNIRRFKQNFQQYQENPYTLANIILWFLRKEKSILQNAELAEQVQLLQVQQDPMETDSQRNLERRMAELKNKVQGMDHTVKCLEEQQDEFDFKFQTHNMEGTTNEEHKTQQLKMLQTLLNRLDTSRKSMLSGIGALLDMAEELLCVLVREELVHWQRRQQKACIGAPDNTCLDQLEKWFTTEAECLFQVRKFLKKLEELMGKVSYERDPVKSQKPALLKRVDSLLTSLLKSAFVVETQPSMPQGKGPLVLRTNVQFSVKTRFLVKFPELNHAMKVNVSINRETPQIKGYRLFNVLGTKTKALNMAESMSGGMVADFRHLTLKEQKHGGGGKSMHDLSLSVTEELHLIHFDTEFVLHDMTVSLETSSLPVVIISNSSQQQSAWASVLWFNMLCTESRNLIFFANSPVATWPQLREMLSWQFLSSTKRGLDTKQLEMIAFKLFGLQQNYDACTVSWSKFNKENVPKTHFTFWVWFDGILVMVKAHLENLWRDGSIMGFVSKGKEKALLKKKKRGTFLIRFSESIKDGGITFSWVDYSPTGEPDIRTVQPFTKVDLAQIPFHEIIRNFQILEAGNVPENPLLFLYPDTPKQEAFGKYYSEKSGVDSPYFKYIKTKLIVVSKENILEAKSPVYSDVTDVEGLETMNHMEVLSEEAAGLKSEDPMFQGLLLSPDPGPMLSGDISPEELQEFLNNPSVFDLGDIHSDDDAFSEAALPSFFSTAPQPCE
ncbi:signal transducer and activator of transcription 2 isoform X2 [Esox lucius]|uniref:signal transducer and activator of transcription 2 isoform X2 n=1 Tax=Esox lucius TaxID=8010 RepID=UPI0010BDE57D|nr:signal transducer and activator of transcription 2 isoform X2 [Esox lucius]